MKNLIKKFFLFLIPIAVLILAVYFIQKLSPQYIEKVQPNLTPLANQTNYPPAKELALKDLNGKAWHLSDLRGKTVVLAFWTSWNKDSISQLNNLNDYAKSHAQNNVIILAADSLENLKIAAAVNIKYALNGVTILLDDDGAAGELYGINVLPLTVFINTGGMQVASLAGPLSPAEIDREISSLQ